MYQINDAIVNRIAEVVVNSYEDYPDMGNQIINLKKQTSLSDDDAYALMDHYRDYTIQSVEELVVKLLPKYLRWGPSASPKEEAVPHVVLYSNANGKHFYEAASLPEADRFRDFLLARPDNWNVKIVPNTGE